MLKHNPKQIEFIEQRKKTDCGVACLAMLMGRLYDEILVLFPKFKKTKNGLFPEDILDVLEDSGYYYNEINKMPMKGVALVAIAWKDPDLSGHYVVWDSKRKQFLDPLHGIINKSDLFELAEIEHIWRVKKSEAK